MKKSLLTRLGAGALILTLVSTVLLSGTLAKYTSTVAGKVKATAASWDVKFMNDTTPFTDATVITLKGDATKVADGKVAPGSSGTIPLSITSAAGATEVGFTYSISIGDTSSKVPIKFYTDSNKTTEIKSNTPLTGTVTLAETKSAVKKTETIYWEWADKTTDTTTDNAAIAEVLEVALTMKAEQTVVPTT